MTFRDYLLKIHGNHEETDDAIVDSLRFWLKHISPNELFDLTEKWFEQEVAKLTKEG